jgi:HK97 family phage major capsid protein
MKTPPQLLKPQVRTVQIRMPAGDSARSLVDLDARTLDLAFASETPCEMWYGTEILSLAPGAMRTGQRQLSMPLLFNHNRNDLLGKVESIGVDPDRIGRAAVRFGKDERGEWAMKQAADEILVNVSFMYRVFKWVEDTEADTLTAIDWEPYEISLVTIPADATVGAGRSIADEAENAVELLPKARASPAAADNESPNPTPAQGAASARSAQSPEVRTQEENPEMKKLFLTAALAATGLGVLREEANDGATRGGGGGGGAAAVVVADPNKGALDERARISEIEAMCRKYDISADARTGMVQRGVSIDQARVLIADMVLQRAGDKSTVSFDRGSNPDLTEKDKARYSMIRAVNASLSGNWKEAGFELEVSNEIAKRHGKGPKNERGFFIPTNIQMAMRAPYTVGTPGSGTTGGTLVATNLLAGSFIEVLRNRARVLQLGATVLSGLVGAVTIPRQTGQTSTFWTAEGVDTSEGEATFDSVSLNMKTIGTFSQITRNMLMQATPDIDMLARADMMAAIALGVDRATLSGSGAGAQPLGIANQSGIGSVIGGTNGAALTIDHLIDLETQVTNANAPEESLSYLGNAKSVGTLKKLKSTTGQYLWTTYPGGQRSGTPGEINGYGFARTNQARSNLTKGTSNGVCSEVFFGAWSEVILGEWGVLEIVPNPFDASVFKNGGVLIRALQSVDVAIRHAASFATISDALTP